jgi:membrane protease YdiL (CAAX protease family)
MRRKLLIGAVITLFGFPLLGWAILYFNEPVPLETMLRGNQSLAIQALIGAFAGILLGMGAKKLISMKFLRPILKKYASLIGEFNLKEIDIIFISFCAGFGEELLFRGSIQVFLGIWVTALIFVAIHGYLNPKNWRITVYGAYMTLAIAALGYLTEYVGVFAACVAHMLIDVILFYYLIGENNKLKNTVPHEI